MSIVDRQEHDAPTISERTSLPNDWRLVAQEPQCASFASWIPLLFSFTLFSRPVARKQNGGTPQNDRHRRRRIVFQGVDSSGRTDRCPELCRLQAAFTGAIRSHTIGEAGGRSHRAGMASSEPSHGPMRIACVQSPSPCDPENDASLHWSAFALMSPCMMQAKSGTGKTLVYAVAALESIDVETLTPQVQDNFSLKPPHPLLPLPSSCNSHPWIS